VPDAGTFAGKSAFGSTPAGTKFYLTQMDFGSGPNLIRVPAMAARSMGDQERCILYSRADGSLRIQLASLLWISFLADLGLLMLTANPGDAVAIRFSSDGAGQGWEVLTPEGWKRVYYTVNNPSPILSINGEAGVPDVFAPVAITPSLEAIRSAKNGAGADLRWVALQDENLDGIDFTGADFSNGNLEGATFANATLTGAKFIQASLARMRCDGATLDRAVMTGAGLDGTSWGSPKSAVGIVLTGCSARDAVLGGQGKPLSCTDANLARGDFRGANLKGLVLTNAEASGAILAGCQLDGATLDGAKLTGAIAVGATLTGASLRGVNAQGANFAHADLSGADLTRAKMGAKAWLFNIAASFAKDLDEKRFVQPALMEAFREQGVVLPPSASVEIIMKGQRWQITDPAGPYLLSMNAAGQIDVFWASPDLRPATLRRAVCRGTRAPGASLSGADLRGVEWYSKPATLDHADLESAALAGSLLVQTDFTQAYLAGADLSGCVLVQASFRGCLLAPGENRRAFSLEGSLLQEADFSEATLVSALLTDAAASLARGVPLFRLPLAAKPNLTTQGLPALAPDFQKAGYPLGTGATISKLKSWFLDNSKDPNTSAPRSYRVRLIGITLQVYDGGTGQRLFPLDESYEEYLARATASQELVAAFGRASYSLHPGAPISLEDYWQIEVGANAAAGRAVFYPTLRVFAGTADLPVYASVKLLLRDWPQYATGLAFSATAALEKALNPASLGPSGFPRAWVDSGLMDWDAFMTIRTRS
jgi:uncharacterized protein YjbI with pentapeptide repeats